MLFSSISFLVFFLPAVLACYYAVPKLACRNGVLFCASLLFYAWGEPKFVLLMFSSILFNYGMGLAIGGSGRNRRGLLCLAILVNLAVLFVFKYLGFSCTVINVFLKSLHIKALSELNLVMPIGISFYTFQEISYLVDVYRKPELAQRSLLKLGLYIAFFPQLIAGPIVRYHDINGQIAARTVSLGQFASGLERFIIGLSKKVLLANSFALVCDTFYDFYDLDFFSFAPVAAWIAALAYALQIYYDFSGYSDMAVGLGRLFGFELPENFNYPYAASSITDFWKRWHISLTGFFRDYVYIPLGGNRKGRARTVLNRFIVFFTTGLWHGAAFNFILWGLAHGTLMTAERLLPRRASQKAPDKAQNKAAGRAGAGGEAGTRNSPGAVLKTVLSRTVTLLCVLLLWVLFRNGTKKALKILLKMAQLTPASIMSFLDPQSSGELLLLSIDRRFWILLVAGILFSFPWWRKLPVLHPEGRAASTALLVVRYLVLGCLLVLCYASLAGNSYNPFIYFRF